QIVRPLLSMLYADCLAPSQPRANNPVGWAESSMPTAPQQASGGPRRLGPSYGPVSPEFASVQIELKRRQITVDAVFALDQFMVRPALDDGAILDNKNPVGRAHGCQAVGDDDGRSAFHEGA